MKKFSLIASSIVLSLFFVACGEDKKVEVKKEEKAPIVKEEVKPLVKEKKEEVKAVVVEPVKKAVATPKKVDANVLYKTCASCHGQSAEREALGQSEVIKGWSKDQILEALTGYKNGTYGKAQKGLMQAQVANKSKEELEALAELISKF